MLSDLVPFDPSLFKEFPTIQKDNNLIAKFALMFDGVVDKENLVNLLLRCFSYVPQERITASQALAHPFFDDTRKEYAQMLHNSN